VPGLYFEEFSVGQRFAHALRRTVTETDNILITALTLNPAALHLDEEYCSKTEFGQRIVNSIFTLGTTVANLGFDEVRFPHPVFHGDTLRAETEVQEVRASKSRADRGIVTFIHRAFNQRDELVASCKRSALMLRKSS
jgi:acyl dehydratase